MKRVLSFFTNGRMNKFYVIAFGGISTGVVFNAVDFYNDKEKPKFFLNAFAALPENKSNSQWSAVRTEKGSREERFLEFASRECNGVIYMTPADFLESVTQRAPRFRKSRHTVSEKEAQKIVYGTPSRRKGSTNLFRYIDTGGLISYTEYLFLLCVLSKPKSGFKIAFNMFDTDMNEEVDKSEFLVMERTMQHKKAEVAETLKSATDSKKITESWFLLKLLNKLIVGLANPMDTNDMGRDEEEEEPTNKENNEKYQDRMDSDFDTTMLVYFFGRKGKEKLRFKDFSKFMEDLQTEVLEIEFTEFSKGLKTISESEFARILLRYTKIDRLEHDSYIKRVVTSIQREQGITFDDFKKFFMFLNNLEDFVLAMKMYTLADRPISPQEFQQAVKATTDTSLSDQLVETLFLIFDADGDGHLSYQEFTKVMKNRLNRGFSSASSQRTVWKRFRSCVSEQFYS